VSIRPELHLIDVGDATIAALDWGGSGPPIVLLHPNGFCGGIYEPIAERLASRCRPIAVDLRGHGGSSAPRGQAAYHFTNLAGDVIKVIDALEITDASAVGGSLGGAVAILADKQSPGLWRRVLLAEPVAFPIDAPAGSTDNPMAVAARRRRSLFPDRATMRNAYSTREPMSHLAPEALDAYLAWGVHDDPTGVRLACDPEVEATIFEISATPHGALAAWDHLSNLSCPATIVAGRNTFLPDYFGAQADRAGSPLVTVDGGHFVLHEDTERAVGLIDRYGS
jgi:pimeloyl-ACP methyl ester carboxylesterase